MMASALQYRPVRLYPELPSYYKGMEAYGDPFKRTSVTPTGAYTLYSTNNTGGGTVTIDDLKQLFLQTSANIGDDVTAFTTGLTFERTARSDSMDTRTRLELDIVFVPAEATATEGFIGLLNSGSALTALPTTTQHLGLFWDASASGNTFLTSADGTTQSTTDTGEAIASGVRRLNIAWTGDDAATIRLYSGSGITLNTLVASQTVTALNGSLLAMVLHIFLQTEAAAIKGLRVQEWQVKPS